ncbi:unnamed protein product, partial [Gordionus sp. m RMFG-2023]
MYDSDHDTQSELDEEEDILAETDNKLKYYLAKNKVTQWKKDFPNQRIRTRQQNIVIDQPGVKEYGKLADTPEKCFDLFITPKMIEEIIYHTNQKIKIVSQNYNQYESSTKEVDITEFKALLGILYLAGIFKSNHQNMSDLWKSDGFGIDIFRNASILASDNVPTISRELNLILTPIQITSPVLPIFNDCTGGILTPHQITSHVLTSFNDCTGGDSVIIKRKRWQINQKKKHTRDSEDLQNRTFSYLS